MLFLFKYVEGSPILLGLLELSQSLEMQFPTVLVCLSGCPSWKAIQPSCQKHLLWTNSQAWEICVVQICHFSLGIQRTEIKVQASRDAAPRQLSCGEEWPSLAEGTAPLCWNQIMVLLDWRCETTLLLGLKRKIDLKGIKTLLYNFQYLISN